MSIKVVCPSCDHVHTVKDDSAGKKLRCKGCQEVIPIPAAAAVEEADPWDTGEMDEPAPRQAPRKAKAKAKPAKPQRARTRSSDGMPIPIIVSMVICGLVIAYMALSVVSKMASWEGARSAGGMVGYTIRILVNISIIRGLIGKQSRIRSNAILLDSLCLVVALPALAFMMFGLSDAQAQQRFGGDASTVIGILAIQVFLWITDLVMLLIPSSRDFCNE